jgi:hypothetical protein
MYNIQASVHFQQFVRNYFCSGVFDIKIIHNIGKTALQVLMQLQEIQTDNLRSYTEGILKYFDDINIRKVPW